jgi:DNA-binding NarL/FixJ family response regulator
LEKVLSGSEEFDYLGASSSLTEALGAARELRPDIMLVDHSSGLKMVFQFISDVRSTWPKCQPVLWVNDLAEIDCFRALQIGARGVLKKTLPVGSIMECLRAVGQGNIWIEGSVEQSLPGFERRAAPRLTPRERERYRSRPARSKFT